MLSLLKKTLCNLYSSNILSYHLKYKILTGKSSFIFVFKKQIVKVLFFLILIFLNICLLKRQFYFKSCFSCVLQSASSLVGI